MPSLHRGDVPTREYMYWIHENAGTGVYDHIGWSWNAWKLWWNDRELYKALAHGTATPYANRLFETGKRPAWKDARQTVLDVDAQVRQLKETVKQQKKKNI